MDDQLALRLGALRLARRRGSVRDAAWAASRLRLEGVQLEPKDARFAHEMLIRFGHALRVARARAGRPVLTPVPEVVAPVLPLRGRRWRTLAAAAVALVVLLIVLLPRAVEDSGAPEGAKPANVGVPAPSIAPLRGRSDVLVAAIPVPVTSVAPTSAPTVTPDPEIPKEGSGGVGTGSAGGGTGSGGSGGGRGSGSGSATPSPTPSPTPTPTVDPFSVMSLHGRVVDARTGRPIPGVCVAIGVMSCARAPITDVNGQFSVDLTIGQVLAWDLKFLVAGYFQAERMVPSRPGSVILSDTRLQPTR